MITDWKVICCHGFLGLGSDWDAIIPNHVDRYKINLSHFAHADSLPKLARELNAIHLGPRHKLLMGYSMGGRIALHMLIQEPEKWNAAVVISANPGIPAASHGALEREKRLQEDEKWAKRFEEGIWKEVVRDWNSLPVFNGKFPRFSRNETGFSRSSLASSLRNWSLGRQADLRPELSRLPMPILWIAGSEDQKYVQMAREMPLINSDFEVSILPGAGHRCPWEEPEKFLNAVSNFVTRIDGGTYAKRTLAQTQGLS